MLKQVPYLQHFSNFRFFVFTNGGSIITSADSSGRASIRLVMSFSSSGNAGARSVDSLPPALCRSRSSRRSS